MQMCRVVILVDGHVDAVYEMPTSKMFRANGQFVAFIARAIHNAAQNPNNTITIESFSVAK